MLERKIVLQTDLGFTSGAPDLSERQGPVWRGKAGFTKES